MSSVTKEVPVKLWRIAPRSQVWKMDKACEV